MELIELNKEKFGSFIKSTNNTSLYQTAEYGSTMMKQGFKPLYVGLLDHDSIIAAALILVKRRLIFKYGYCPRGFIIDYNNSDLLETWTKQLKKFLNKRKIIALKICPPILTSDPKFDKIFRELLKLGYYHFGYNQGFEALKPRFEALVDLTVPFDNLFFNIRKEYRTKIRSASNHGILIKKGEVEDLVILHNQTKRKYNRDLQYFSDLYEHFSKQNEIDIFYAHFDTQTYLKTVKSNYELAERESDEINNLVLTEKEKKSSLINRKISIDQKFSEAKNKLIEATKVSSFYPNGINLASALVITHKDEAYVLIDGLKYEFKSFNAKHLLIWKLIENYQHYKFRKFNMGGITNPAITDEKFSGLNQFKLSFNATPIEYIGDFELIINNSRYFIFSKTNPISKIFPLSIILKR